MSATQNPPGWTPPVLDARKQARMIQNRVVMRADRAVPLVAAVVQPGGPLGLVLVSGAVFRMHTQADQTEMLTLGTGQIDALVELPLTDPVSGMSYDGLKIAYLALTGTATTQAVAQAEKYEVLGYHRAGMVTNRIRLYLRRVH